ncbi:unnamed protein product [Allacma fusca]|uniref:CRAL-TRIO domain-containing protein n=1 Tax=Allacma fusca TaxID=39272 RepID=A0A8J2JAG6_9HEXA|nr:unnamed protein product [Allacma fusca]
MYLFRGVFRMMKSLLVKDTEGKEVRRIIFIGDWAGLDITQVTHAPTIRFCVDLVRSYLDFLTQMIGRFIGINVSYPAEVAFQLVRPFLGGVFERVDLFGTNKAKWSAVLRKLLPQETIPTWYGGSQNFKPLQVFG